MMYQRPIFDEKLVKLFEYDIDIIKYLDGQPNKIIDKLVIHPIEVGNTLEFKRKKDTGKSFSIPIKDIIAVTLPEQKKGSLNKEDLLLEIEFYDSQGNKGSIAFNVEDIYVQQIIDGVKAFQKAEEEYWDTIDLEYDLDGIRKTTKIYYRGPFLSEGEELLWINTKTEGIINRQLRWLEALTNFKAIYYDFTKHDSGRIPLCFVDDVIVTNQKTTDSDRFGAFTEGCDRIFTRTGTSTSYGTSRTIGDVSFMKDGKPTLTFLQVSDPDDIASLAKAVIKQLFTPLKAGKKTQLPVIEGPVIEVKTSETGEPICSYCGNVNQIGSEFCSKCGFALR
ncbi:MAG: zinc ribbon domain-containing protein [Nitrososphaerales archaeon]